MGTDMGGVTRIPIKITTGVGGTGAKKIHISGYLTEAAIDPSGAEAPSFAVTDSFGIALTTTDSASNDPRRLGAIRDAQPVDEEVTVSLADGGDTVEHNLALYVSNTARVKHGGVQDA